MSRRWCSARDVAVLSAVAALSAVVLVLTACTPVSPAPPAPDEELPAGISVRVFQSRFDYASRTLKVSVTNDGNSDLDLRDAAFSSPYFAGQTHYGDDLVLSPGMTRDLPVVLPSPVCSTAGEASGAPDPATVVLTWQDPDGRVLSTSVTPRDDTDVLAQILAEECLAEAVRAVASIAVGDELRIDDGDGKPMARVDITIAPTGAAGTLTLTGVRSTVLLAPTTGESWPLSVALTADSQPLTVALDLRPTRCDPHAIAEDKRGTVFPLELSASSTDLGTRSGLIDVTVSDHVRSQIYDWITQYCNS
ncbi:hypothetical protein [Leifsonia sp. A12D58]|uniref:hypothetical protein n=1 Tax=Leifsonia sp. A12D58 TaxID=3397674 RepID=UPI0039E00C7C